VSKYFKVEIIKCSNKDFWYVDKIGNIVLVCEVDWPSSYFECKRGDSILKCDVELIKKS